MRRRLQVTINKGRKGVPLGKLAAIARETERFLESLGYDLGMNSGDWIADNFKNGSVIYDLSNPDIPEAEDRTWYRAIRSVVSRDVTDSEINVRISRQTRRKFVNLAATLDPDEILEIGVYENGHIEATDVFLIDREIVSIFEAERPNNFIYHGEIQGAVHALFKEARKPKLSMRDLSTKELVDCYFQKEMYQGVIELLRDEDAVIFVEGEVTERSESGIITEINVTEFTPAPTFDVETFESQIGAFPQALTGGMDTAQLMDDFRDT